MTAADSASNAPPNWLAPALLGALLLVLQALGTPVRLALRYERDAVLGGELWRLVSAHVVHLGWIHCLLNLAAFWLCVLLSRGQPSSRFWCAASLAIGLGVGLLLLLASPEVPDYVGVSGVVYGLFVCVLGPRAWYGDRAALLVLLIVLGRMAWQLWAADPPDLQSALIGGNVVAQAHGYGVICGLAWLIGRAVLTKAPSKPV